MPDNHRFILSANGDWFQREARKIGPHAAAYISALLKSRRYPQHAYRSYLGILNLAHKHPNPRLETACQILLEADFLSYRNLKSELEHLMSAQSPDPPLPAHENVRGNNYYQ